MNLNQTASRIAWRNRSTTRLVKRACLLAILSCGLAQHAQAAVYTWNVGGGGDWTTASNWTSVPATGTAPANGNNTVNINPNGGTVTGNPAGGDDKFRFLSFDNGRIEDHDRANADNVGTWEIGDGNAGNGTATFAFGAGGPGPGTFRGGTFNVNSDGAVTSTNLIMGHGSSNAPTTLNIKGGSVTASGNLTWIINQTTINLSGGSLAVTGDSIHSASTTTAFNVTGGSLTADEYTVNGWGTGESLLFNITGSNASLIQFRQWDIADNSGGIGSLNYTLVTGQTLTPISLTDSTSVFAGNAANFKNNFTLNFIGSGVDDTFSSDLVLFKLTNANNFDGLTELLISDLLGTSFRQEGDSVLLGVNGGQRDFLLHFNSLRTGNLDGDLEVWLENYVVPAPEPSSILLLGIGMLCLRKRVRRG